MKSPDSNPAVLNVPIYTFKKMGLLKEAPEVILSMKGCSLGAAELVVSEFAAWICSSKCLILCVSGVWDLICIVSLVWLLLTLEWEMLVLPRECLWRLGEKGLCSNVVMFSQLITGLCWVGSCGDAFDLGKEMASKVLVADSFTMQRIGPWIVQRSQVERCASGSMKCVNWA